MTLETVLLMVMFFAVIGMIVSLAFFRFIGEKIALNILFICLVIFLSIIAIFIVSVTLDTFGSLGEQTLATIEKAPVK